MTERYDPTGSVILELRGDAEILAAVDGRPKAISGEGRMEPPHIVIVVLGVNPRPFGAGSNRLGLSQWTYAIRCVIPAGPEAAIEASRVAGLVATRLNNRGWRSRIVSGDRFAIARSDETNTTGPVPDPDTKDATAVVLVNLTASAQAVG